MRMGFQSTKKSTYQAEQCGELREQSQFALAGGSRYGIRRTVFFFARSPDAPKTTMTVLSLSSTELRSHTQVSRISGANGVTSC